MNIENSKTNDIHKFFFDLSHRLDSRSSNKHVALQNLSINYTWIIYDYSTKTINSKKQLQRGMMSLDYLMVLI